MGRAALFEERDAVGAYGNHSVRRLPIEGPLLIASACCRDERGFFVESYNRRNFTAFGVAEHFVQDNHSLSVAKGTVRGMHFQLPPRAQAKLVRVVRGAILDIAVDIRRAAPTYGQHVAVELSASNGYQLYVPIGFAHGFCTLEPNTEVIYKVTDIFVPELDRGIAWDDPELGLPWPLAAAAAVLSEKDRRAPRLRDVPACFE